MSIIPIVTATRLLFALKKAGFIVLRQKGSHIRLWHPVTRRATTIAMHTGEMTKKMIFTVLKQAGVSLRQFIGFLR